MLNIKIETNCKDYNKANAQTKKVLDKAMDKLARLIIDLDSSGVKFEKIFNNDVIKYDILGKNFYTFKFRAEDKTQLRALYRFNRVDDGQAEIELHKFFIKRNPDKSYIKVFESYVNDF